MTPDQEIRRGNEADRLLNDPLFVEAFTTVEAAIIEKWKVSPIRDREGAHELKLMLKLVGDLKGYIEEVAKSGKLARISSENPANVAIMQQPFNR